MKLRYFYIICTLAVVFGCSDFLDVTPKDKQTQEQLFTTKGGFYAAVNGIYNGLATQPLYGKNLSYELIDILGKRYINDATNTYFQSLNSFTYSDAPVETALLETWSTAYRLILNSNVVLHNITQQEEVLTETEATILRGEMLAVRAYLHFDMLRLFGPVYAANPKALSIPYNESEKVSTLPLLPADSIIYNKILRDLKDAETLLAGKDPVIAQGPMASLADDEEVHLRYRQLRFNYYAVLALKARVYLYAGDKVNALTEAQKLLNDPVVSQHFPPVDPNRLLANYTTPDRVFSTEVLMAAHQKERSEIYTRYFDSENAGSNFIQPRDPYVDGVLFNNETQDYRYQSQWQRTATVGKKGFVFIKYRAINKPEANDPESEYFYATLIPLLRLSEVYYIAAECETDLQKGYEWLNTIRQYRGTPELAVTSATDLASRIRTEYLREFMGEGQIFFLYKRLGIAIAAAENGFSTGSIAFSATNVVLPMPVSEIENR